MLDQRMVEERHATLDRSCHAHLILLHQSFDEIGLQVGGAHARERVALAFVVAPETLDVGVAFGEAAVRKDNGALAIGKDGEILIEKTTRARIESEKAPLGIPSEPPRQSPRESFGACAELLGHEWKVHSAEALVPNGGAIPRITEKQLVGPLAGEHDLDVLPR